MSSTSWIEDKHYRMVNEAVEAAELETSAEIVPVIAGQSDDYPRSCDLVGVWVGLLMMFFVWAWIPEQHQEIGSWGGWSSTAKMVSMSVAMLVGFMVGMLLTHAYSPLRRGFTPRRDMLAATQRRAKEIYFDQRVGATEAGQGILFYISLFEQTATVLADQLVIEALGEEAIETLGESLVSSLHTLDAVEALVQIIEEAGEMLAEALPREEEDENELPNELVVI